MMTFSDLTSLSLPAARALVHFLWQGLAVALVAAVILVCMRRARPGFRYAVALGALVVMASMPILTVSSFPSTEGLATLPVVEPASGRQIPASAPAQAIAAEQTTASASVNLDLPSWLSRLDAALASRPELLVGAWALGVFFLLALHLGGVRRLRGVLSGATPAPNEWQGRLRRLARSLDVGRAVELRESTAIDVPMVAGWVRPVIVVPASAFFGLAPEQLEAVLAHELAHVRRGDFLVNLFQVAMETLFFYHPAVWWVSRQVRIEREHCCDDLAASLAVERSGTAVVYLRALATLEAMRRAPATPGLALGADGGSLLARVRRLTAPEASRRSTRQGLGSQIFGTALAAVFAALLAATGIYLTDTTSADAAPVTPQEPQEPQDGETPEHLHLSAHVTTEDGKSWRVETGEDWVEEDAQDLRAAAKGTQWADLDDETLRQLARWGFDEETFSALDRAGISASGDDLELLARYGIDEDLIDAIGQTNLTGDVDTLISLGRYGLDGDDLRGYQRAGLAGSRDEVLSLARYGLDGDDLAAYQRAGVDTSEDVLNLARYGLDADDIAELAAAGYPNLTVDQLVDLARHGLDGDDVAEFAAAGYTELSVDELVRLARHGVDGDDIQALSRTGHAGLSVDELVDLARQGVDGEDIAELQQAGLENLSIEQIRDLARHGIDGDDVVEWQRAGLKDLTVEQLIALARYGLDGDDLDEVRKAGYTVSYDEVMRLARSGQIWLLEDDDDDTFDDRN